MIIFGARRPFAAERLPVLAVGKERSDAAYGDISASFAPRRWRRLRGANDAYAGFHRRRAALLAYG